MRFPAQIVVYKDTQKHGFRNTGDRLLVYGNMKFKQLLFLRRFAWIPRFHPSVQRPNTNARKQRVVSSLSSNCLKFSLSLSVKTSQNKSRKSITIRMFDANNISTRSEVCHVRLDCLQSGSKIALSQSKSLKTSGNVTRYNLRIFTRILPNFDNNIWPTLWLCFLFRMVSLQAFDNFI